MILMHSVVRYLRQELINELLSRSQWFRGIQPLREGIMIPTVNKILTVSATFMVSVSFIEIKTLALNQKSMLTETETDTKIEMRVLTKIMKTWWLRKKR